MDCSCDIDVEADERYKQLRKETVKARKEYICGECGKKILKGEQYEYYSGVIRNRVDSHKTCMDCLSVRDAFFSSWSFGDLWEDVRNYISDVEGDIPEKCITTLTPRAQGIICDLIQDEWEDKWWEEVREKTRESLKNLFWACDNLNTDTNQYLAVDWDMLADYFTHE